MDTDVFISYARENRGTAQRLAEALARRGLAVWWDRDLEAGSEFANVIEAQLGGARAVVVLWSAESVRSGFVRDESSRALRAGKLLPVRLEEIDLPLGFGQLHTLDLIGWDGDDDDPAFAQLVQEIQRLKGAPRTEPEAVPRRLARRPMWRAVLAAVLVIVLGVASYEGKRAYDRGEAEDRAEQRRQQADEHFRAGLSQQFAKEPALEGALNEYLSAVQLQPQHARAHYYLAHVYVQTNHPQDALQSFRLALASTEAPLDNGQRAIAQEQVAALSIDPNEAKAVARADTPSPPPPPAELPQASSGSSTGTPPLTPAPAPASAPKPEPKPEPVTVAKRPERIPPPAAMADRLNGLVASVFGDNKERRVDATTSLIVDPDALSDAVPIAVEKALALLRGASGPLGDSAASGVVNTLVLLQSATPGTLEANRSAIEALLAAAKPVGETTRQQAAKVQALLGQAATRLPVAYIQIANRAQRPLAESIAAKLREFGYATPGIEDVGSRAPARTEIRVQGRSDRGYARWMERSIGNAAGATPLMSTLRNAQPKVDTYEVWLARDLCVEGGPKVDGCGPG